MALKFPMLHLLLCLIGLIQLSRSQGITSGSGENATMPEDNVRNKSCRVPAYSQPLYEVNATEENTRLLLTEGRCYLLCLSIIHDANPTVISTYSIWPFAVLNHDAIDCNEHLISQIHECTRGCRIFLLNQSSEGECQPSCNAECENECNGTLCLNPDTIDLWIARRDCELDCQSTNACLTGCNFAAPLNMDIPFLKPLPPVSPPTLVEIISSTSSDYGLFSINLTNAVGSRSNEGQQIQWSAFLFKILDLSSNNVTYIWQMDPREMLDLSSHICREVEVSFSVVNLFGSSAFSKSTRLYIEGDVRPHPPTILQINDMPDTRIDFFQHVSINVTWESLNGDPLLTHFEVTLERARISPSHCQASSISVVSEVVQPTSQRVYSALLEARVAGEDPIMGCNYSITVSSVGVAGNRSVSQFYTSTSMEMYKEELMRFSCNKEVAINNQYPYFNFIYDITMLISSLIEGNYIMNFQISREKVKILERGIYLVEDMTENKDYNFMPNKTTQMFEDSGYIRFKQPKRIMDMDTGNYSFRFQLYITWNMNNLVFPPMLDPYNCITSALLPPPSDVRNFTLWYSRILTPNTVSVSATWLQPSQWFGIFNNYYEICITREEPLSGSTSALQNRNSWCEGLNSSTTMINNRSLTFIQSDEDNFGYLQIRPGNDYTPGYWSEPHNISLKAPPSDVPLSNAPPPSQESNKQSAGLIAAITIICLIIVIVVISLCAFCLVCFFRALRRRKKLMKQTQRTPNFMPMFGASYSTRNPDTVELMTEDTYMGDEWEILPSAVSVDVQLGEGAFGKVYSGYLKGPLANAKVKPEFRNALHLEVAIKLLKDTAKGSERQDFLSEIEMMKKVSEGHNPHVVAMLGCVTAQEPLSLVTEYVKYGDLLSYLRSSRKIHFTGSNAQEEEDPYLKLGQLTPADLPSFSYQIAAGMAYLSSIGIVHRDLACRNILVSADKELKITDFGLSRETEDIYVQKSTGRVPFKWMAIESIVAREFTSASDVWAFGVVLWEIETLGGVPYPGVSNAELLPLLKRGHRMEKPDGSTPEIYDIMLSCWHENSAQRPSFQSLKSKFNDILLASHESEGYVDFSIDPNKLCYKTDEEESQVPPSINLPPSSPQNGGINITISSGSHEALPFRRTSFSSQGALKLHGQENKIAHSSSGEKLSSVPAQFLDLKEERRPRSLMLLKPSSECENRRKSGADQYNSDERDDRYVQDPSSFFGIPDTSSRGGLETDHEKSANE